MKQILLVGGMAAALACGTVRTQAQVGLQKAQAQAQVVLWATDLHTLPMGLLRGANAPSGRVSPATGLPVFKLQGVPFTNLFGLGGPVTLNLRGVPATGLTNSLLGPATACAPGPGVYKTEPYSCLVVVPGPTWDDKCIIGGGETHDAMPTVKPDLRFVPWEPNK